MARRKQFSARAPKKRNSKKKHDSESKTPYPNHLPSKTLSFDQLEWMEPRQPEYNLHRRKKGCKNGAFAWVRNEVVDPFLDQFYADLEPDIRAEFRPFIAASINNRFNNIQANKQNVRDPTDLEHVSNPENMWYFDNKAMIDNLFKEKCKKDNIPPGTITKWDKLYADATVDVCMYGLVYFYQVEPNFVMTISARRSLICEMFKALPEPDQLAYRQQFEDKKRALEAQVVDDPDRLEVSTPLGAEFFAAEEGAGAIKPVEGWLSKISVGELPTDGKPNPFVWPAARELVVRPRIPDLIEHRPNLSVARSWLQLTWNVIWQLYGGGWKVPDKEIKAAIAAGDYCWVPKECIPHGTVFDEPGQLRITQCLSWLTHLQDWKLGDRSFWFSKVYTPDGHTLPEHPEESSRELALRNGHQVAIVTYDVPLTQPQNIKPVLFPPESWAYFYYVDDASDYHYIVTYE
ncbi:hypothetical protein FRC07_011614 [Ceratobasidium sp. 392]|nr:hypothetical protein FRC07_011614 [Ceratobasidium sp. 392]